MNAETHTGKMGSGNFIRVHYCVTMTLYGAAMTR